MHKIVANPVRAAPAYSVKLPEIDANHSNAGAWHIWACRPAHPGTILCPRFPLAECKWHYPDRKCLEQEKRGSDKIRFNPRGNVRFHFACAAVHKHLLLDARHRCRDFV